MDLSLDFLILWFSMDYPEEVLGNKLRSHLGKFWCIESQNVARASRYSKSFTVILVNCRPRPVLLKLECATLITLGSFEDAELDSVVFR